MFGNPTEVNMAAKAVDRRIQRTRQMIQKAFLELVLEKGYDEVTIQNVLDRANVGRSTFYAHFQDKEDLFLSEFEALRDEFEQEMVDSFATGGAPWDLTLKMFQHAQLHHGPYKALTSKQTGAMMSHMNEYISAMLRDHLAPLYARRKDIQVPVDVMIFSLVSSFMALLIWWLDHDMPYPPETINGMYRQLTEPGVMAILSKAS
jgi:AcrR family transcriptional regulator